MGKTVMAVFERTAREHADTPALKYRENDAWHTISFADYHRDVMRAARGFMHLGLGAGQAVSIIGYNCPQWLIADIAAIAAGGFPAGIYTTSSPEQCRYIAGHSESVVAVVENAEQLAKFRQIRNELPDLKAIVLMRGEDTEEGIYSWTDLLALGERVPEEDLRARINAQRPHDLGTLIYTSGTTGDPKAVMLSHQNLTWIGEHAANAIQLQAGEDILSYLPLSHIAEQNISVHAPIAVGATVWFAQSLEKLADNLREVRPHSFFGVPRVWEKIQTGMQTAAADASPLNKRIAIWARGIGLAAARAEEQGRRKPLLYPLARKLVFDKVHARLGLDRCRYRGSGAAPIARETLDFFASLDMPLYEVYGQSESTGAGTINLPGEVRSGSIGKPWPGTEVSIADDGEILLRGPHLFRGYMKNEKATRNTFDVEGWLLTGDVGTMDDDGFVYIRDRKKELIITAGGENISPAHVEGALKTIAAVSQVCIVGDRRNYLSALFTLDEGSLAGAARDAGSPARSVDEAVECETFRDWFGKQVVAVNATLAQVQAIKRWTILPADFSVESGELTPTMKLKRRVVHDKYADEIERLYQ